MSFHPVIQLTRILRLCVPAQCNAKNVSQMLVKTVAKNSSGGSYIARRGTPRSHVLELSEASSRSDAPERNDPAKLNFARCGADGSRQRVTQNLAPPCPLSAVRHRDIRHEENAKNVSQLLVEFVANFSSIGFYAYRDSAPSARVVQ